jgi:uncharacterized protein (DUF2062 family)
LKKLFKKHMPDPQAIAKHRWLRHFSKILEDPNLLHFNRKSIPVGVGCGVFAAFIPLPVQILVGVTLAIWFRGNIAAAAGSTLISNPATYAPIYYFCFVTGNYLLGNPAHEPMNFDLGSLLDNILTIGKPLLIGCFVWGLICGVVSYFAVSMLWRLHVVRNWDARRIRRHRAKQRDQN